MNNKIKYEAAPYGLESRSSYGIRWFRVIGEEGETKKKQEVCSAVLHKGKERPQVRVASLGAINIFQITGMTVRITSEVVNAHLPRRMSHFSSCRFKEF